MQQPTKAAPTTPLTPTPLIAPKQPAFIVRLFAQIGNYLVQFWTTVIIGGIVVSILGSAIMNDNFDLASWPLTQSLLALLHNPQALTGEVISILLVITLITITSLWSRSVWNAWQKNKQVYDSASQKIKDEQAMRSVVSQESSTVLRENALEAETRDFLIKDVNKLQPSDCNIVNADTIYLDRLDDAGHNADQVVRDALTQAATRPAADMAHLGVCVVGPRGSGKSRLAYEALIKTPALQSYTFVYWPSAVKHTFQIDKTKRYVLWLENLQEHAQSFDRVMISKLNQLIQSANSASLVIIVTCNDGNDLNRVRQKFPELLRGLQEVRVAPITADQAQRLSDDLTQRQRKAYLFDGVTPSSIVNEEGSTAAYESCTEDEKLILRTLKLLQSAGIATSASTIFATQAIVTKIATTIFDSPTLKWRLASNQLYEKNLIDINWSPPTYERIIFSPDPTRLKLIVNDYPLGIPDNDPLIEVEDWPALFTIFSDQQEVDMLYLLGRAFADSRLPFQTPNSPSALYYSQKAADCFRSALAIGFPDDHTSNPDTWALWELYLADTLNTQSVYMAANEPPTRLAVLTESEAAYRDALTVFTRQAEHDTWLSANSALVNVLRGKAAYLEAAARDASYDEAEHLGLAALRDATTATADVIGGLESALAYVYLNRSQTVTTPDEARNLQTRALTYLTQALQRAATLGAIEQATAQGNLAYGLCLQASLQVGAERLRLLHEAETNLRQAMQRMIDFIQAASPPKPTVENQSDVIAIPNDFDTSQLRWTQILLGDVLLQLAREAPTPAAAATQLDDAEVLARDAQNDLTVQSAPDNRAWVQAILAGVLAEKASTLGGASSETTLTDARNLCNEALTIPNRESAPEDWAGARLTMAKIFLIYTQIGPQWQEPATPPEIQQALAEAQLFLDDALTVYHYPAFAAEYRQAQALQAHAQPTVKRPDAGA